VDSIFWLRNGCSFSYPWLGVSYHLPLHCWGGDALKSIGDTLGKYIDKSKPKSSMYACAKICEEFDLDKGFLESIQLTLDGWTHIQKLYYEQLPFKCKRFHECGHFAKDYKKKIQEVTTTNSKQREEWNLVKKKCP